MPTVTYTTSTPGPCACCGIGGVTMFCRTRGGTASLCGYPEYTTPSNPPRLYRKKTFSGVLAQKHYNNSTCTPPTDCDETFTYSGNCSYDATTCLFTTSGTRVESGTGSACNPGTVAVCGGPAAGGALGRTEVLTQTSRTVNNNFNCFVSGGQSLAGAGGSVTENLTDEDLESDAIARLLAGAGGTWGAWTTTGNGSGGTCQPVNCCQANYQQRTASFSFGYQESQFKVDISGLSPLTAYVLEVKVYRRLYGSTDPWSLLLDSVYGFTSDALGNYEVIDNVPNLEGYETYAGDPFVYQP